MRSGLRDMDGVEIKTGDFLLIKHRSGAEWVGKIIFEDGVFTVSVMEDDLMQVRNPNGWKMGHDWIKSRHWSTIVGYGEYGTWNVPRQPITKIVENFKSWEELKPLYEKFGYLEGRIINARII